MDFGLTDEQRMLQDSVGRYLDDACPLDRVRKIANGDKTELSVLTTGLHELGVMQVLVPVEYGGLGLGLLEAALIHEALGQRVAPVPILATSLLPVTAIRHAGDSDQCEHWLPAIAEGTVRMALAANELSGSRENAGVRATDAGDGSYALSGKALFVLNLPNATHAVVADTERRLFIAELESAALSSRELTTIDKTRATSELMLNGVRGELLAAENEAGAAAQKVVSAAHVLLAADTLGAASTMIEKAVSYAAERQQFKRVVGSFQAVKHMCAEMVARLEPCRSLVWYAAYAADTGRDDAELMALLAKSHLAEVGQFIARTATEVHGGMGFTDLLGLHYWFKRIGANRQLFGGPERLRAEAARIQGWA